MPSTWELVRQSYAAFLMKALIDVDIMVSKWPICVNSALWPWVRVRFSALRPLYRKFSKRGDCFLDIGHNPAKE